MKNDCRKPNTSCVFSADALHSRVYTHRETAGMANKIQKDIKYINTDGVFAHMYATLTGGVFLTGFAIHLGMNELLIGMLASLPFIATWFQLPTSFFIWRYGRRKRIVFLSSLFSRLTWVAILAVALLPLPGHVSKPQIILVLLFFVYTLASISQVSWLSWVSDLIPDSMRGSVFGTRNMLCSAAGMVTMLVFGKMLDRLNTFCFSGLPSGFTVTFMCAVAFGAIAIFFLSRISEPEVRTSQYENQSFRDVVVLVLLDKNFRKFLTYAFLWSFSVHLAGPFLTLYFIRDLKLSYAFIAVLGTVSATFDLIGMRIWGVLSDRIKNKAVIQFSARFAVFIPLAWVMVRPGTYVLPIVLHVFAGVFWAGINLCTTNLLLRISGQENRAVYLSIFSIVGGLGAVLSPMLAGAFLRGISGLDLYLFGWKLFPIQILLIGSTLFRLLTVQTLRRIKEPEEGSVKEIIRILKSVRGMNISSGFSYLLHPFVTIEDKNND